MIGDPLDGEIRRMMGRLSALAPLAPAADELLARGEMKFRPPGRRLQWCAAAGATVVLAVAVAVSQGPGDPSMRVATGGGGQDIVDVRLEDLVVTHIPEGFTLEDDTTESVPATIVPDPQAPGRGVPQGNAGTMRTQRYNRGDAPGSRAVVYVTVLRRLDEVQTLSDLRSQVPGPQSINVGAKEAVLSVPEPGASGLIQFRWVESPHVAVMLSARGPVSLDEVRRMAEGVRFGAGTSSAAPVGPLAGAFGTPARAPGGVRVLVANATETPGLAGRARNPLLAAGYDTQPATDALRLSATSVVHFRPGFDAEARAVARVVGIPETAIDPSLAFVADPSNADVVVVLGQDFVSPASSPVVPTTTAPDTPARRLAGSAIRVDGFGPMFVGMLLDNARAVYGESRVVAGPPPCPFLAYADGDATVTLTASTSGRFDLVTVRGGAFMTDAAGVRIGSSVAALIRAYGEVDLHGRSSSVNGVPTSSGQTLVYLPSQQPDYAMAFEVEQGVVVGIRAGGRERVTALGPC